MKMKLSCIAWIPGIKLTATSLYFIGTSADTTISIVKYRNNKAAIAASKSVRYQMLILGLIIKEIILSY